MIASKIFGMDMCIPDNAVYKGNLSMGIAQGKKFLTLWMCSIIVIKIK